jgi:hypothetical protein
MTRGKQRLDDVVMTGQRAGDVADDVVVFNLEKLKNIPANIPSKVVFSGELSGDGRLLRRTFRRVSRWLRRLRKHSVQGFSTF